LLAKESDPQIIGVPGSIDNDLPVTDLALGVDTAVNTIADAVRKFADTAASHHRIMVLETMGRDCGELARLGALASGAEIVVTPERGGLTEEKMLGIAERLETSLLRGRSHAIVLIAEGVKTDPAGPDGPAHALAKYLQSYFRRAGSSYPELETRPSVLGHLQRGGTPTVTDRILAARYAEAAWQEILPPKHSSGVLGLRKGEIRLHSFDDQANAGRSPVMQQIYQLQKDISKW